MFNSLKDEAKRLRLLLYRSFYIKPSDVDDIVDNFHRLYYDARLFGGTHGNTMWLGVPIYKCPTDLVVYQEMIHEIKPDVIVETGTMDGGSALFMASMCDLIGNGRIVSIDIDTVRNRPQHDRITYLLGSSTSDEIVEEVRKMISGAKNILVVLDSDHTKEHVLNEMLIYSDLVSVGSYMIVEDTNMNGHPVAQEFGPGPMEAVEEFMRENDKFEIDKDKEKFYLTFNPNGYLKRVS